MLISCCSPKREHFYISARDMVSRPEKRRLSSCAFMLALFMFIFALVFAGASLFALDDELIARAWTQSQEQAQSQSQYQSEIPVSVIKTTYGEHNPLAFRLTLQYTLPENATSAQVSCMGKTVDIDPDSTEITLEGDYHGIYKLGEAPKQEDAIDWVTLFATARGSSIDCVITAMANDGDGGTDGIGGIDGSAGSNGGKVGEIARNEFSVELEDDGRVTMEKTGITASGCVIWTHGKVSSDIVDSIASAYENMPANISLYTKTIHIFSAEEWTSQFNYSNENSAAGYAYGKYVCLRDYGDAERMARNMLHEMTHNADLACRWSETDEMARIYEDDRYGYGERDFTWEDGGSGNYMSYNVNEFVAVGSSKFFRGDNTLKSRCPEFYDWCIKTYGDEYAIPEDPVEEAVEGATEELAIVMSEETPRSFLICSGLGLGVGLVIMSPVIIIVLVRDRKRKKREDAAIKRFIALKNREANDAYESVDAAYWSYLIDDDD